MAFEIRPFQDPTCPLDETRERGGEDEEERLRNSGMREEEEVEGGESGVRGRL